MTMTASKVVSRIPISEAAFQTQVIDLAHLFGWRVAHFRAARTARGWRTPVAADGKGFPDLVLTRNGVTLYWECKAEGEKARPDQQAWLDALGGRVVYPSQWDYIQEALR